MRPDMGRRLTWRDWPGPLQRQGLDERTVGTLAARTLDDGFAEDSLHGSKVRDFGLDILQVRTGHDPDLGARAFALISELEKLPDFFDGKPERPGAADEGEALEMRAAVSP